MLTKNLLKSVLLRLGIVAVVFLVPILWSAFGRHGYFQDGFCLCGGPSYYYFQNDTLCELTPGHGDWGHPVFSLRRSADGWEAQSIATASVAPASTYTFVVMTNDNRSTRRLRLQGGDLYELWGTNWMRYPRVYNVWSVWFQQFFTPPSERKAQKISCINNLKQIGLAFRIWEGDHGDQYPFNISTNAGGTLELCALGKDGFDRNTFLHFKAMRGDDYLRAPLLLVCPQDRSKKAATNWASLGPENVTYRLRSGKNVSDANPHAILAVCPVDGNILYCDGTVSDKAGNVPAEHEHELSVHSKSQ
jgi:hypothetical protein